MTATAHTSPARVLVIRRRYLGDVVLLGRALRDIRLHWPSAHIAVAAEAPFAPVLRMNPDVNEVLLVPGSRAVAALAALAVRLRRERFTHVFDIDNTDKTALLTWATGALLRVAFQREDVRVRMPSIYTDLVPLPNSYYDSHHITETYGKILAPARIPSTSREVRLVPPAADVTAAKAFIAAHAANPCRVLLHPGSRSPARIWPPERFAAVCDRLQRELKVDVFVVAGPREQGVAQQIAEAAATPVHVVNRVLSVPEFAAMITCFRAFLCHDSGPMHVAAAVGTPVVALLGSQNSRVWHPWGERHTILQTQLPCPCIPNPPVPCDRYDTGRSYCVRRISTDEVFAALTTTLAQHPGN